VIKTEKCNQCKEQIYNLFSEFGIPESKFEEFSKWLNGREIGLEEHKETILCALQDYRRWFADDPDDSDTENIKHIDKAIEYVRCAE